MSRAEGFKKLAEELEEIIDLPPRMIRKEVMVPKTVDICPTCNKEIGEKEIFTANLKAEGSTIWQHRPCGGFMRSSEESEEAAAKFFEDFDSKSFFNQIDPATE